MVWLRRVHKVIQVWAVMDQLAHEKMCRSINLLICRGRCTNSKVMRRQPSFHLG
jgi:hypothetical protein